MYGLEDAHTPGMLRSITTGTLVPITMTPPCSSAGSGRILARFSTELPVATGVVSMVVTAACAAERGTKVPGKVGCVCYDLLIFVLFTIRIILFSN